jgi:hypothetical protein
MSDDGPNKAKRSIWPAMLISAAFVCLAAVAVVYWSGHGPENAPTAAGLATAPLPFGPTEEAYTSRIHFSSIKMSRASNFLNQEITYVDGTVENAGDRDIFAMDVTIRMFDFSGKAILHQTERIISSSTHALPAGQRGEFHIGLESVPDSWNRQYPDLSVTGLRFH